MVAQSEEFWYFFLFVDMKEKFFFVSPFGGPGSLVITTFYWGIEGQGFESEPILRNICNCPITSKNIYDCPIDW